jgi:hypothetical protein
VPQQPPDIMALLCPVYHPRSGNYTLLENLLIAVGERPSRNVVDILMDKLSEAERDEIRDQFESPQWAQDGQVMWSGVDKQKAQKWATEHGMQTLTDAMGPLMDPESPQCRKEHKSKTAWSNYIKGASAMFAEKISEGDKVTVLARPPPAKLHPSGMTNYQQIEEPILKGRGDSEHVEHIDMVHPQVKGAEESSYQIWPEDKTSTWTARFGEPGDGKAWRPVKGG